MNTRISLNGLWDFVVDLDPKYHAERNYAQPQWNRRHWLKVPVPGVWNKYAERYDLFEGVGWFAREFTLPDLAPGATCLLRFGGVNYLCEVFVNGKLAGTHEGGYTEFTLDVSHLVHTGQNVIAVRVDNRSLNMKLPAILGYFNYGGIHRDVTLEVYSGAYLADITYEAFPSANGGVLRLSGRVAKAGGADYQVVVSCAGSSQRTTVAPDGQFSLELTVPDVVPWSPDSPALYPARVSLEQAGQIEHACEFAVGFRKIVANGTHLELNGNPIHFCGICYVYDSPAFGGVMRPEQYELDLELFQELKVNAIRSHFPLPHDFLSACDRAGIMVWVEIPVYCIDMRLEHCRSAFKDPSWLKLALSMLDEMIQQSKLHPSVCIYSIGNECQVDAPGAHEFFHRLSARARELDPTRLISYACLYGLVGNIAELVDVVGFNEYWGWYDIITQDEVAADEFAPARQRTINLDKLEQLLQQAAAYEKPVFLTEFGADSIPGYRSGTLELWSEDYHAQLLRETLAIAERYPFVCGTFPFVFADYRDPSKEINAYWDELNYKGVVSYKRQKKLPFAVLQEAYARRRTSHG